jgi:DNA-directed RNA polymerase subunit beta'
LAYHHARRDKEELEAAEREAARQQANPFEDSPVTVGADAESPAADIGTEDSAE